MERTLPPRGSEEARAEQTVDSCFEEMHQFFAYLYQERQYDPRIVLSATLAMASRTAAKMLKVPGLVDKAALATMFGGALVEAVTMDVTAPNVSFEGDSKTGAMNG